LSFIWARPYVNETPHHFVCRKRHSHQKVPADDSLEAAENHSSSRLFLGVGTEHSAHFMSAAFEAALGKLGVVDRTDPMTTEVAKLIIEFAK
jgi:hypothetical protein